MAEPTIMSTITGVDKTLSTMLSLRKALGRIGILENPKDEEAVKKEEINILSALDALNKRKDENTFNKTVLAASEAMINISAGSSESVIPDEIIESRDRKGQIRESALAMAKERGDIINVPTSVRTLGWVIQDSKAEQRIYRDYLKGVIAEEKAKATNGFAQFDNEHPADRGGSPSHFQDKSRAQQEAGTSLAI